MSKLFFHSVAAAQLDPIFGLLAEYEADTRRDKINLSVGVYRNEQGVTPILESVKLAEVFLLQMEQTKEYLPIEGHESFLSHVGPLVFGDFFWLKEGKRVAGVQTLGGTGALRLGGDFLKAEMGEKIVISDPTWPNHRGIFTRCQMVVGAYPYYDMKKNEFEFERMYQYLKTLTPGTIVVLQPCCHNPTGADPTLEQWKMVLMLCRENGLLPFFDFAYQGLGANLQEDAAVIRLFANEGMEMLVAVSQSKNFGLYAERTGALFVVTESELTARNVLSKIKTLVRTNYSNPPQHGAKIVEHILSLPELKKIWMQEVDMMRERIDKLRHMFVESLVASSRKKDFRFLADRKGMFCFTGLSKEEVHGLKQENGIYMTGDGRINISDLTEQNIPYVVKAITSV